MNVRKITLAAASLCLLITACKKDDAPNSAVASFTMYKPGNYWIYQSYITDENGNGTPGGYAGLPAVYDSVYIEKDTPINGFSYHKLMKPEFIGSLSYQTTFLRDSLNYVVDIAGHILLAPDDFSSTFRTVSIDPNVISHDSGLIMQVRMADRNKIVTVPAGTFPTISLDKVWNIYPFAASNEPNSQRRQHQRYAGGIGMITETMDFYMSIPTYEERRLIRYSVK